MFGKKDDYGEERKQIMKVEVKGKPGTGNTFQEINIKYVKNYNPNLTTIKNYYGTRGDETKRYDNKRQGKKSPLDSRELHPIRKQILSYVSLLSGQVADKWKHNYMKLWNGILDLDAVSAKVYEPGKQQKTNFNRNLVANIIYLLGSDGRIKDPVYAVYNASLFTELLEGDKDHPVRAELRKSPPENLCSRIEKYIETFQLKH